MEFTNKTVLITGAAGGIGKQIALTFAKEGCNVVIVDMKKDEAEETVRELSAYSQCSFIYCDISETNDIPRVVEEAYKQFGRIDILVNNAGIPSRARIEDLTEEHWDKVNDVNLKAVFFFSKEVSKIMKIQKYGKIINISSLRGILADETHPGYSITKAAVFAVTRNFAVSLAKYNINVNTVTPGYVLTPMTEHHLQDPQWLENFKRLFPVGRCLEMQEIADTVVFLASEKASGIVGQNIIVDGGRAVWDSP